tara:strand:- start:5234 stop:6382 length:1149 start_codon:yes stop_codon:yes gene_type:complete
MKITILGRGNAGCLTALHYGYYTRNLKNVFIELIYDAAIPPEKVGQASLLSVPDLLWKALGINWYDNLIEATPKLGILYENWGSKKEKSFASPFPLNQVALHYSPAKMQELILKSGYFSVQEKHVDSYEEIDSDFIFDCRGKPADNSDNYEELINPLNAVLLGEGKSKEADTNWTRAVATPDGWTFVIPNTTQTTSYGYLYNDKITPTEEASANFEKIFSLANQGIYLNEKVDNLKFKNYVAKKPIMDDRIILGGNRLFFLEPLESTAVETYMFWARKTFDWIINKTTTPDIITREVINFTHQLQNYIIWHYTYGSKYDTPFWRYARKLKIEDPVFDAFVAYSEKTHMVELLDTDNSEAVELYGQWTGWNFKHWLEGVTKQS